MSNISLHTLSGRLLPVAKFAFASRNDLQRALDYIHPFIEDDAIEPVKRQLNPILDDVSFKNKSDSCPIQPATHCVVDEDKFYDMTIIIKALVPERAYATLATDYQVELITFDVNQSVGF